MINSDNFSVDFVKFYLHYVNLFLKNPQRCIPIGNKKLFPEKKLLKTFTSTSFSSDLFYNEKDQ